MSQVFPDNQYMYDEMVGLYEEEKFRSAIKIGKELLEKARVMHDRASERKSLEVLSYASYFIVDYISAMNYIIEFSKVVEEDGNISELIKTYNVFISLYTRQGDYEEALNYLKKVEILAKNHQLKLEEVKNENNYGFFYNTTKSFEMAIPHLERAVELASTYRFYDLLTIIQGNLALSYLRTNQVEKSKMILDQVFLALKPGSSRFSRAEAYMYRGEIYAIEGDYLEAINQVKASKVISLKHGYIAELAEATRILSEIYVKTGDFEKAYFELKDYIEYSDILSEDAKQGAVAKLKAQYDMNKKNTETDLLKEQYAILEEQNRKIQEQANELERLNEVLARQNDDLHQSAIEDYLTGVYNRKYFTLKLREEFSIAKEHNRNLAAIIIDIDHFKKINDTYGHLVGDEIIKHISGICEESLDSDSIIGRFGGDEFMVLMIDADIDDAEEKANEFISSLAYEPLVIDKKPIPVTLSIGVADNRYLSPRTSDEMIHIADQGLYLAKDLGRNRCCRYVPDEEEK